MDKEKLQESYTILDELLRQANSLISPLTHHHDLERLTPQFMMDDAEKNPKCYLKLTTGRSHAFFPLCSRNGIHSPEMIKFSQKLANKMNGMENVDQEKLRVVIAKLDGLQRKYSKPIPKPSDYAYQKGLSTSRFNKEIEQGRKTGLNFS